MMSETPQFSLNSKNTVHPIASPLAEWSCVALSGVEEPMGPIDCSSLIFSHTRKFHYYVMQNACILSILSE